MASDGQPPPAEPLFLSSSQPPSFILSSSSFHTHITLFNSWFPNKQTLFSSSSVPSDYISYFSLSSFLLSSTPHQRCRGRSARPRWPRHGRRPSPHRVGSLPRPQPQKEQRQQEGNRSRTQDQVPHHRRQPLLQNIMAGPEGLLPLCRRHHVHQRQHPSHRPGSRGVCRQARARVRHRPLRRPRARREAPQDL